MPIEINYVEFPAPDLEATKHIYGSAFGWEFADYGPHLHKLHRSGVDGGFTVDSPVSTEGVLVVLFSDDLEATQAVVEEAGAEVVDPIFSFPGGRRFVFLDPNGNRVAVWGEESAPRNRPPSIVR